MRVKMEMEQRTFQLIRDAMADARIGQEVRLKLALEKSEYWRESAIKDIRQLAVAEKLFEQSRID